MRLVIKISINRTAKRIEEKLKRMIKENKMDSIHSCEINSRYLFEIDFFYILLIMYAPKRKRDGWLVRRKNKNIRMKRKQRDTWKEISQAPLNTFFSSLVYVVNSSSHKKTKLINHFLWFFWFWGLIVR